MSETRRPKLGIDYKVVAHPVTPEDGAVLLLLNVFEGGLCHAAGLRSGDFVTEWNGTRVTSKDQLTALHGATAVGSEITWTVLPAALTAPRSVTMHFLPPPLPPQPGSPTQAVQAAPTVGGPKRDPRTGLPIASIPQALRPKIPANLQGAVVHFCDQVGKINKKGVRQERICMLTDQLLVFLNPEDGHVLRCDKIVDIQKAYIDNAEGRIGLKFADEHDLLFCPGRTQLDMKLMLKLLTTTYRFQKNSDGGSATLPVLNADGYLGNKTFAQHLHLAKNKAYVLQVPEPIPLASLDNFERPVPASSSPVPRAGSPPIAPSEPTRDSAAPVSIIEAPPIAPPFSPPTAPHTVATPPAASGPIAPEPPPAPTVPVSNPVTLEATPTAPPRQPPPVVHVAKEERSVAAPVGQLTGPSVSPSPSTIAETRPPKKQSLPGADTGSSRSSTARAPSPQKLTTREHSTGRTGARSPREESAESLRLQLSDVSAQLEASRLQLQQTVRQGWGMESLRMQQIGLLSQQLAAAKAEVETLRAQREKDKLVQLELEQQLRALRAVAQQQDRRLEEMDARVERELLALQLGAARRPSSSRHESDYGTGGTYSNALAEVEQRLGSCQQLLRGSTAPVSVDNWSRA